MKKIFTLFLAMGFIGLIACGPSAEDKAKQEAEAKAKMDSLFNAAGGNMATDSTAAATTVDTAKAAH